MPLSKAIMIISTCIFPSFLYAMSCSEYNSMGPNVNNIQELNESQITKAQIDVVRENTALKAGRVAALQYTPMATKLKRIMSDNSLLAELASGTPTLVRIECFENPDKDFYETVSEQFEFVVEQISQRLE
jgi:hypothetical protein